jgi:hypothetical protein
MKQVLILLFVTMLGAHQEQQRVTKGISKMSDDNFPFYLNYNSKLNPAQLHIFIKGQPGKILHVNRINWKTPGYGHDAPGGKGPVIDDVAGPFGNALLENKTKPFGVSELLYYRDKVGTFAGLGIIKLYLLVDGNNDVSIDIPEGEVLEVVPNGYYAYDVEVYGVKSSK